MSKENTPAPPFGEGDSSIDFDILPSLAGHHIGRAYRALFEHFCKTTAAYDITPRQFVALVLISANPNSSQTVVAKAAGIERSTMVSLVDTLQERSLILRNRSTTDRRSYALSLTEAGKKLIAEIKPLVLDHDRYVIRHLTADDISAMMAGLDKILLGER